jgi:hypothetical protein
MEDAKLCELPIVAFPWLRIAGYLAIDDSKSLKVPDVH